MKNDFGSKDSSSRMKGFYLALLSCIGILVVVGLVLSYRNFNAAKISEKNEQIAAAGEKVSVAGSESIEEKMSSYVEADEKNISTYIDPLEIERQIISNSKNLSEIAKKLEKPEPEKVDEDETPEKPTDKKTEDKKVEPEKNENTKKEENETKPTENKKENTTDETAKEDNKISFADDGKMSWPLIGEILMDYSIDRVVYDKTLDMYRTNDSICISAPVGSQVKATAEGVVKSIQDNSEHGKTVVIDNGNGWQTTYSQLQEKILVAEGDVVKIGQVIGGVGTPSKYSVLLGSHLDLRISKNDSPVDPKTVLVQ